MTPPPTDERERTAAAPIHLTRAGTPDVIAYACGACGIVAGSVMAHGDAEALRRAVQCCAPSVCSRCGKQTERRHRIMCRECEMDANWMREAARFCKATVVDADQYGGPVFNESHDRYSSSLDEAIEEIDTDATDDPDAERTFYVYACDVVKLPRLDAADIISDHCERAEMHKEAHEHCDAAALQVALDAWHAAQKVESWMVDYSRVVVLDEASAAEYRAAYNERARNAREVPHAD